MGVIESLPTIAKASPAVLKLCETLKGWWSKVGETERIPRIAEARSQEMQIMAATMNRLGLPPQKIEYADGKVCLQSADTSVVADEANAETLHQVARALNVQIRRQQNAEIIVSRAAKRLESETTVADASVDEDWIARFFRIAEDITTEQMQELWSRVLAGEVKRPGSFSLRTLDVLRNMSQAEAQVFRRVSQYALRKSGSVFLLMKHSGEFLLQTFGITVLDLTFLRELNLISPADLSFNLTFTLENPVVPFVCGHTAILVQGRPGRSLSGFRILRYTETGVQLLELLDKVPADMAYVRAVGSVFRNKEVTVKFGKILRDSGGEIEIADIKDIEV